MAPIKGKHYLTQGYGRTSFAMSPQGQKLYKAWGGEHKGLDFGTKGLNLPAISTVKGKVILAGRDGGFGNHVEVEGPDGWRRQYAHLQTIAVKVGDLVEVGTELGKVGSTGSSTAVHLHYGHRKARLMGGWEYRDPSFEVADKPPTPKPIKSRLIKANDAQKPQIYVYNGQKKFLVPDLETLRFLFGQEIHELIDPAIIDKLPSGPAMTSLR